MNLPVNKDLPIHTFEVKKGDKVMLFDNSIAEVADNNLRENMRMLQHNKQQANILLYVFYWRYFLTAEGFLRPIKFTHKQLKERHSLATEIMLRTKEYDEQRLSTLRTKVSAQVSAGQSNSEGEPLSGTECSDSPAT